MTPERYRQACWLFHETLEMGSAERAEFLAGNCGNDTSMIQFVLKGLGSVSGDQVDATLRNAIRNY